MITMEFCVSCGNDVVSCGADKRNLKVALYGCYSCDVLYEEEWDYSPDGSFKCSKWKTSDMMFSEWRALQKQENADHKVSN